MFSRHRDTRLPFVLQIVRLRRLLEHTRRVMNLVEDAREKLEGEYIFDRHYILALVDRAMEELGRVVYHGAVVCPAKRDAFYDRHDAVRDRSRELFEEGRWDSRGLEVEDSLEASVEFRMLSAAIEWMEGVEGERSSVLALMFEVVDAVLGSVEGVQPVSSRLWEVVVSGVRHRIAWVDLELVEEGEGESVVPLNSAPLRVLLGGAESLVEGGGGRGADWIAAVSGDQVSFFKGTGAGGGWVYVEAALTGHAASDYLLVYDRGDLALPEGLKRRETAGGVVWWLYDVDRADLEQVLARVGGILLGRRGG